MAASLNFQSALPRWSWTNGKTWGAISSSQQLAIRERHTPAALHGFQSSSSSYSSCDGHMTSHDLVVRFNVGMLVVFPYLFGK